MNTERISRNFYKFVDQNGRESFDSYTNLLEYRTKLQDNLNEIIEMVNGVELLGFTEDDLNVEEIEL
jgi:hypothetical protein